MPTAKEKNICCIFVRYNKIYLWQEEIIKLVNNFNWEFCMAFSNLTVRTSFKFKCNQERHYSIINLACGVGVRRFLPAIISPKTLQRNRMINDHTVVSRFSELVIPGVARRFTLWSRFLPGKVSGVESVKLETDKFCALKKNYILTGSTGLSAWRGLLSIISYN